MIPEKKMVPIYIETLYIHESYYMVERWGSSSTRISAP
jgi:hypothetical protein